MSKSINSLTTNRVWARVQAAADEIEATFSRQAFSWGISREGNLTAVICGPDGAVWTQGHNGNPFHAALLGVWLSNWTEWKELEKSGSVWVTNDPYRGGCSLCEVRMATPIIHRGNRVGLLACFGHYGDIGGRTVGGVSPRATDVQQEGTRIIPTLIARGGVIDTSFVSTLAGTSRFPEVFMGDLQAQFDGLIAGARRFEALLKRYSVEKVLESASQVAMHTHIAMDSAVAEIAGGEYLCIDRLDGDGISSGPIRLQTRAEVIGGNLVIDFKGSCKPVLGPMNCSSDAVRAACIAAVRHLFPEIPLHGAMAERISVKIDPDSFLNAQFPQPVGGSSAAVVPRIQAGVLEALSKGLHGRGQASSGSGANLLILRGLESSRHYAMRLSIGGGGGASGRGDGLSNCEAGDCFTRFPSIESLERSYPIRVLKYELRAGSGGPGRYLGGMGSVFEFELLDEHALLTVFFDRGIRGAGGLMRGTRGETSKVRIRQRGRWESQTKAEDIPLISGDQVRVESSGGGGFGHPYERSIRLVANDVREELLTRRAAALQHGVLFSREGDFDYDTGKTFKLRSYRLTAADVETILDEVEEDD